MAYAGKLLTPPPLVFSADGEPNWLWKEGFLCKNRRTIQEAKQLASRNMVHGVCVKHSPAIHRRLDCVRGKEVCPVQGEMVATILKAACDTCPGKS